ncbi:nucleolar protein 4 [Musca domestica]|uniref:Nucleolar protein 4 n=1 Tax=Musca domestica TaxID=7370 RepID=A0A9J7CN26_MUSDO|nr:nucleolar protein 4 [Musca domestica]
MSSNRNSYEKSSSRSGATNNSNGNNEMSESCQPQHDLSAGHSDFQTAYPKLFNQPFGSDNAAPDTDRKLYPIEEQQETELELEQRHEKIEAESADNAYDADVDDDLLARNVVEPVANMEQEIEGPGASEKILEDKMHIYQLFQPWALKTYGDLAKTKTITMRKKVRILKALEGKEHSRPDSSKFRFWVKTKGFTTKRPESFEDAPCTQRQKKVLPPDAVLSENPADVDLYVASTTKDLDKRTYRKVAVVEEFFDIIYQIHMELGGRSGMHAGQKRTYRIISETYAFLPREAVTRFLSICPECKKNLRPSSPTTSHAKEDIAGVIQNESSSEVEVLNYSSHTESSMEAGPTTKTSTKTSLSTGVLPNPVKLQPKKRRYSSPDNNSKVFGSGSEPSDSNRRLSTRASSSPVLDATSRPILAPQAHKPKIRVNPNLQRPYTPPTLSESSIFAQPCHSGYSFDYHSLKSRGNMMRYYDFMRRLYSGNLAMPHSFIAPPTFPKELSKKYLKPVSSKASSLPTTKQPTADRIPEMFTSSSSDEDPDNISAVKAKRFKISCESSDRTKTLELSSCPITAVADDFVQTTQIRAINLSKNSSHFSAEEKIGSGSCTPHRPTSSQEIRPATSTPTSIKQETVSPPKSTLLPSLRIPQIRSISGLPPLDFERLKPITSTYLQLTRSMGLSDEEALRFDNLSIFSMTYLA